MNNTSNSIGDRHRLATALRAAAAMGLVLTAMASSAQSGPQLSLPDAIRIAEGHSDRVRAAQQALRGAKARTGEQRSRQLPTIGLGGTATEFDNRTTVTLPGSNTPFEEAPDHYEQLSLVLNQNIDVTGQVQAAISQAKLASFAAQYDLKTTLQDQDLQTTLAYYEVLRAEQDVRVASSALDSYKEQLKTTTRLFEGGVGLRLDVDRSKSQVATAESDLIRRRNALDSANSALNDLLGRPLDADLELAEPQGAAAKSGTASDSELIAKAWSDRSEALAASLRTAAASKGIKLAQSSVEPTLGVSLAGYNYPTTSFEYPRSTVGALSVTVSIPLFDGGLAREKVNEARSDLETAKAQQSQTKRDIALQVRNFALAIEAARKRLDAANASLEAAKSARDLAQQRYGSQVSPYLEVTDAQAALTAAQSAQVEATYDLLIAQAQLDRSVGRPIAQ